MKGYSPKLPLAYNKTSGPYVMLTELKSVVSQNLKMLILTVPGERLMDSNYGVGARNVLFSSDFAQTSSELRQRLEDQISTYMGDVVQITSTRITRDEQFEEILNINIEYFIKNYNTFDNLSLLIK